MHIFILTITIYNNILELKTNKTITIFDVILITRFLSYDCIFSFDWQVKLTICNANHGLLLLCNNGLSLKTNCTMS